MTDWTSGYVAEIDYTFGYYTELNPLRVKLAFLNAGLVPPEIGTACELGYGQGMSANIHAAASVVQWHGTDFNPSQAGFAQELAASSGSGAQLHDDAFAEFCARPELPEFDYIGLHGIWSWISDENRSIIVDFIRRKLKVGGVLYISYNTLPGWATFAPMRHLLKQHASTLGADGAGLVNRIEGALGFADKLLETNPLFSRETPAVTERFKALKSQNRNYLAHEYFNSDWHPMYFADMAKCLSSAKLNYACSAHLLDHVDAINLSAQQQTLLQAIPDAMLRESVRDFIVNQQFRKDFWIKGARKLAPLEQVEALRQLRVVLTTLRADVPMKVTTSLGDANMNEAVYTPVLDALADHKITSLAEIEQAVRDKGVSFGQMSQAIVILAGAGHIQLAQDEQTISRAKQTTDRLNAHLLNKSRSSTEMNYLASPVTGGGITVRRFAQMFLQAHAQGLNQPAQWAEYAWKVLATQNQQIVRDGKQLQTPEENLAELHAQAQEFNSKLLPVLTSLQVA